MTAALASERDFTEDPRCLYIYTIGKEAISKHNYFKKVITNEQEITEYSKCLDLGLIGTTGIPLHMN